MEQRSKTRGLQKKKKSWQYTFDKCVTSQEQGLGTKVVGQVKAVVIHSYMLNPKSLENSRDPLLVT